jgi:DNA repair protein RecO (recombination protein O)
MAGRGYQTEAVVLRSFRLGEADRVLHLYTLAHGRIGAVAKGVRKTKSRFGARLEPLSHVQVSLHRGSGELQTITGVDLISSHRRTREDFGRLSIGLIGAEAMLRLFVEEEGNPKAFLALTRFLDVLDGIEPAGGSRPELDPLALAFQLKLLWLAGYLPHLTSCAECGTGSERLVGYSPQAGGAVCRSCAGPTGALGLTADGIVASEELLRRPLGEAQALDLGDRAARDALTIVTSSYEFHGGFRLRTLTA